MTRDDRDTPAGPARHYTPGPIGDPPQVADIRMAGHVDAVDAVTPEPAEPPMPIPVDLDAAVAVGELLGIHAETDVAVLTDALTVHRDGFAERARLHFVGTVPDANGDEWDAIVHVAELVGRLHLESMAP